MRKVPPVRSPTEEELARQCTDLIVDEVVGKLLSLGAVLEVPACFLQSSVHSAKTRARERIRQEIHLKPQIKALDEFQGLASEGFP